jgi:hypothetical protein
VSGLAIADEPSLAAEPLSPWNGLSLSLDGRLCQTLSPCDKLGSDCAAATVVHEIAVAKMEMRIAAKTAQVPVRVIDRSFRDGKRNLALTGTLLARAVRERSKHPKSPPGSIPDVDIDEAHGNLSENFARPLDFDTFGSVALTASQAFHHAPTSRRRGDR